MANLTSITKNVGALSAISKPLTGGQVFYAWLFWFTISDYKVALTNVAKNAGSLTSIAKS